jgi:hypothetical protein
VEGDGGAGVPGGPEVDCAPAHREVHTRPKMRSALDVQVAAAEQTWARAS